MVSCNLMGGLGNQMFQVSVTYNLAKINNDVSVFNFSGCTTNLQGNTSLSYLNNIFSEFLNSNNIIVSKIYEETSFSFKKIEYTKNLKLIGYFQSEKYFLESGDEIKNKFLDGLKKEKEKYKKINSFVKKIKGDKTLVSVHVRRGDYLNYSLTHTPCSLQYYNNSLSFLKDTIGDFLPIIITDDKEWCKENFKEYIISPFENEIEDFILMTICEHNIIANSTFSWWGAYLNQNKEKIIIGPKKWFGPNGHQDQQDIIPNKWIKF